jgi:hypothetical protein
LRDNSVRTLHRLHHYAVSACTFFTLLEIMKGMMVAASSKDTLAQTNILGAYFL